MMMTTVPSYLTHCLVSGLLQELPRCTGFLAIIVETISSSQSWKHNATTAWLSRGGQALQQARAGYSRLGQAITYLVE